jgi:hypothetical protein
MNTVHRRRPICQDSSNRYVPRNRIDEASLREAGARCPGAGDADAHHRSRARASRHPWSCAHDDLSHRRASRCAPRHRVPPLPRRALPLPRLLGPFQGAQSTARPSHVGRDRRSRSTPGCCGRLDLRLVRADRAAAHRHPARYGRGADPRRAPGGALAYLADVEDGLAAGWGARGRAAKRLRATIGLALDFLVWRSLHERGLSRTDAVAVMSSAVRAAAVDGAR